MATPMDEDMKPEAAAATAHDEHPVDGPVLEPPNASAMMSQGAAPIPQSFTPLQSRRLPQAAHSAALCPTMDLIALGLGNVCGPAGGGPGGPDIQHHHYGASPTAALLNAIPVSVSPTVMVHRTISWQKLLTLGTADLSSPPADEYDEKIEREDKHEEAHEGKGNLKDDGMCIGGNPNESDVAEREDNESSNADTAEAADAAPRGATSLCWSPDGRSFAVGLADGGVLVHDVERSTGLGTGAHGGSGPVHSLPPGPVKTAPPLPKPPPPPPPDALAAVAAPATPAKPVKVTTRSMTASRRLRSGRRGGSARGGAGSAGGGGPPVWKKSSITGLTWARVGPPHPDWEIMDDEEEIEDAWRYRCNYLDRSSIFLPPCSYSPSVQNDENFPPSHPHYHGANVAADDEEADEAALDRMARPSCRTPLSLLCVTTCANGTSLYLHGRYRILTVTPPAYAAFNVGADAVCTADLGSFLILYTALPPAPAAANIAADGGLISSNKLKAVLSLCFVPSIPRYRYELQTISSLYCSILMAHVRAIGRGLRDAASSWTGALRQLDVKFDNLVTLLRNYSAIPEVPTIHDSATVKGNAMRLSLRHYIVSARSQRFVSAASALDQFFGAPLMNDQLLQRMIRTLESSASSVEGHLRKNVLAPSRSLVWDSLELKGLAGAMDSISCHGVQLMDPTAAYGLCRSVESLHLTIQTCLRDIIDARCRLRDFLGWMRSTASSVKARGTAPDSALRENARKRRVDDSVVKRVASYFVGDVSAGLCDKNRSLTECVLGVPVSDYFCTASLGSAIASTEAAHLTQQHNSSSVKDCLTATAKQVSLVFQQPRVALSKSVRRIDVEFSHGDGLSSCNAETFPIAIHRRMGVGSSDTIDAAIDRNKGCFNPALNRATKALGQSNVDQCRHWILVAKAGRVNPARVDDSPVVQIVALPCAAAGSLSALCEIDEIVTKPSFYLESFVSLPPGCKVSDIKFYGDDGSSSLSSGIAETVVEGRQSLGLLVKRVRPGGSDALGGGQLSEELVLFQYADLPYRFISVANAGEESNTITIPEISTADESVDSCCIGLGFVDEQQVEVDGGWPLKRRIIKVYPKLWSETSVSSGYQASRFALSGSRGVGGVFSEAAAGMDLFDLEEEEDDEEEGEESFDM
eukprot:CAMPEP_0178484400 /NCGR_PEP_ID=MMETSP0696-20121128/7731_1 /TAXON_ID=265572 /ORGANISM="Extubocellulus spinifer, Strain CCMP396" /LENGTH=1148 /DNA_ID=CAMNT_0020111949 /DNA_START=1 /DNA_END=3447 /DNA_ORIENTATION=+